VKDAKKAHKAEAAKTKEVEAKSTEAKKQLAPKGNTGLLIAEETGAAKKVHVEVKDAVLNISLEYGKIWLWRRR